MSDAPEIVKASEILPSEPNNAQDEATAVKKSEGNATVIEHHSREPHHKSLAIDDPRFRLNAPCRSDDESVCEGVATRRWFEQDEKEEIGAVSHIENNISRYGEEDDHRSSEMSEGDRKPCILLPDIQVNAPRPDDDDDEEEDNPVPSNSPP